MIQKRQVASLLILICFYSVASGVEAATYDDWTPSVGTMKSSNTTDIIETKINTETSGNVESLNIDQATATKGIETSFFDKRVRLFVTPGVMSSSFSINLFKVTEKENLPWKLKLISDIYELNIINTSSVPEKAFNLQIGYDAKNNFFKQVYYYDENKSAWKAMPTTDYPNEKFVRTLIKTPKIRFAVFANESVLTVGKASWYAYKPGMFCASPDFAKGSKLRVTNLDTGKSIEVQVNDWGPERKKHPDRVVDLSKEAFKALAPLGQGTVKVSVSPIEIAPDRYGRVLGVKEGSISNAPVLSAKSAIILNEGSGQIVYAKNTMKVAPLASLTKLAAVSVFLKQDVDLNKKVTYKKQDAKYNELYASVGEAAQVKFSDGDSLTVKDLLYASLVASANNAVESLVRVSGLSRDKFIDEMNNLVDSWGAKNTHFVEPTGLSPYNVSTVEDYAIISKEAYKNKDILAASVTPKYTINILNRKAKKTISNTNKLVVDQAQENLKMDSLGINGSKTGYIREAGYCLMTRFKSVNGQFVIVTFGASSRDSSFNEMMDLIKYANLKS